MIPVFINMTFADSADDARFNSLVNNYWSIMFKVANAILGNEKDAEDATQNAFISLYRKYDKYKDLDEASMVDLIYFITKNRARDIYRKNQLINKHYAPFEDGFSVPVNTMVEGEEGVFLKAMSALSESDKRIIIIRYYYEYDIRDIAKEFRITVKGAYKKIERAKERLAKALSEARDE